MNLQKTIRETLISIGVETLKEHGFEHCDSDSIFIDADQLRLFRVMLSGIKELEIEPITYAAKQLIQEIETGDEAEAYQRELLERIKCTAAF